MRSLTGPTHGQITDIDQGYTVLHTFEQASCVQRILECYSNTEQN